VSRGVKRPAGSIRGSNERGAGPTAACKSRHGWGTERVHAPVCTDEPLQAVSGFRPRSRGGHPGSVCCMSPFDLAVAGVLVASLGGGLVRIARGPSRGDRMLAAQLFGTTGVAVLLVVATGTGLPVLRDVALVFTVLATVNAAVFVRHGSREAPREAEREP
jgi:multicomponent Na+:H+ antiporter subunit F